MLDDPESKALPDGRITTCNDLQKQVLHYRLLIGLGEAGQPPWNDLAEGKVGELHAKVVLEQGYLDGEIEAGGVSKETALA